MGLVKVTPIGSLINRVLFKVNGSSGDSRGDGWSRIVTIKSTTLIMGFNKQKKKQTHVATRMLLPV